MPKVKNLSILSVALSPLIVNFSGFGAVLSILKSYVNTLLTPALFVATTLIVYLPEIPLPLTLIASNTSASFKS